MSETGRVWTSGRFSLKGQAKNYMHSLIICIIIDTRYDWAPTTKKIIWTGSSVQSKCSSVPSVPSVLSVLSVELIFVRQKKSFEPVQHLHISSVQVNRFKMKILSNFEYGLVGYPYTWTWLESDQYPPPMVMTMGWSATQTPLPPLVIENMKIEENSEKFRGPPGGL